MHDLLDQQRRITLRVEALLNADTGERLLALLLDLGRRYGLPIRPKHGEREQGRGGEGVTR